MTLTIEIDVRRTLMVDHKLIDDPSSSQVYKIYQALLDAPNLVDIASTESPFPG